MPATPAAPTLEDTLSRLLARERGRRRDAALSRASAATALAAVLVAAWRIYDRVMGREPVPVPMALGLVALTAVVGVAFAVRAATSRSEREMAREVDRRLGLDDRASAALTIVRDGAASRLAAFVVDDAESALRDAAPRVDAAFPSRPTARVTTLTRWTAKTALVLAALAALAELLVVGGPLHWLPGISRDGGEPTALVPPTKDAPHRDGKGPERRDDPDKPTPPDAPPDKSKETPKPPAPAGSVKVEIKPSKEEYEFDEPVTAAVTATATGETAGARVFDLRVTVDGVDVDAGVEMNVDPSRPEGDRAEIDLRRVPGLTIAAGEHVARARLATRTTHEEHESEPVKFRVRAKKNDDEKKNDENKGAPPKPKPKPEPPKPEQPPPQSGEPEKKEGQPTADGPPPPPPALDKKVVVPLFGEGDEVKKRGLVLVLDPGGGLETPPKERPLDEALPDARRRAESAVDRAGVRDEDRELVRRYFELLEGLRK